MPLPRRRPGPLEHDRLVTCLQTVGVARARLRGRRGAAREIDKAAAREDLLDALEQYASAITDLGAPIPRRIRTEIVVYRRLRGAP